MSWFKKRDTVDIQILRTESLISVRNPSEVRRFDLSPEELSDIFGQITDLARPEIVRQARELRRQGHLDQAFAVLLEAERRGNSSGLRQELSELFEELDQHLEDGRVGNELVARMFFLAGGFDLEESVPQIGGTRLTVGLGRNTIRVVASLLGSATSFFCYCPQTAKILDTTTLGMVQDDLAKSDSSPGKLTFVVCLESSARANRHIRVHWVSENVIIVPLELSAMQRALWRDSGAAELLHGKLRFWKSDRVFAVHRPVSGREEFFGRQAVLAEIQDLIRRDQSFYILGSRRMGKTSLLAQLEMLGAFRSFLYAFFDLEGVIDGRAGFSPVIDKILEQWSDGLRVQHPAVAGAVLIRAAERPAESASDRLEAFLDALEWARRQNGQFDCRCLVILDDVNLILTGAPSLFELGGRDLLRRLRHRQGFVVTGVTVWDFEGWDQVEPGGGLGKYTAIYLSPMSVQECQEMIEYLGGIIDLEFPINCILDIFLETGGHPLWTRDLCDSISRGLGPEARRVVRSRHVEAAVGDFLMSHKEQLRYRLESLTREQKRVVAKLSELDEQQSVAASELGSPETVRQLGYYGVVEWAAKAGCRLRMGLLRRFIRETGWRMA